MSKAKEVLLNPIFNDNPIALQILGICSALAVTGNLYITLIMCVALTTVVTLSNLSVSLIRNHIPTKRIRWCWNILWNRNNASDY